MRWFKTKDRKIFKRFLNQLYKQILDYVQSLTLICPRVAFCGSDHWKLSLEAMSVLHFWNMNICALEKSHRDKCVLSLVTACLQAILESDLAGWASSLEKSFHGKKKKKKRKGDSDPSWKLSARDGVFPHMTNIFLEPQVTMPPDWHLLLWNLWHVAFRV